tara:strand:+ start:751 stop:1431 length:681 start_codon:yes stop_codon:yes gene_type:complete
MKKKFWLVTIPQRTIILFVILNILAMLKYPGGTLLDPSTSGYSFIHNFLSDLGRFVSWNGHYNFYSNLFFNLSMMLTGLVFSIFFFHVRSLFQTENIALYWVSIIGTIFGIAGGISMIGVALTPSDLFLPQHIIFANWLFRFFFLSAVCYTILIYITDSIETKYAIGYCIFALLILAYIVISEFGPSPRDNMPALLLQVIAQKSILFCFFMSIYVQTRGIRFLVEE